MGELLSIESFRKPPVMPEAAEVKIPAAIIKDIVETGLPSTQADIETAQRLAALFAKFREQ